MYGSKPSTPESAAKSSRWPDRPSRLRRANHLVDRLPIGIVVLAFVAASSSALAAGLVAVGAEEPDVELLVGYTYRSVSNPCGEVLPFGLVVPSSYATVTKCIEVHNRSDADIFGLTLTDADVGDGPTLIESLGAGDRATFYATVDSEGDLSSTTRLTVESPALSVRAESRTFVVEGARISGNLGSGSAGEVSLTGRTRSGHRLDRTVAVDDEDRFEFDELPPSNLRGYWLTHGQTALLHRTIVVAEGDQVNVTSSVDVADDQSSLATSSTVVERSLVAAPQVLAFDAPVEPIEMPRQKRLLIMAGLLLSGLTVALAIPARKAPPTGR